MRATDITRDKNVSVTATQLQHADWPAAGLTNEMERLDRRGQGWRDAVAMTEGAA